MTASEDALTDFTSDASFARSKERSAQIDPAIDEDPSRFGILTGDRPIGHLHPGRYFGTLRNRVSLRDRGAETWVLIAGYQVTTDRNGIGPIREHMLSLIVDYLATDIDPRHSTIFSHSVVLAFNQLMLSFLSLMAEPELCRNPTMKSELEASDDRAVSGLMLTYPVRQAADILFCKVNLVPVGQDQLPYLGQARFIAQRLGERYGRATPEHSVLPCPEALSSEVPSLLGADGPKTSKSRGNTIEPDMNADETAKMLKETETGAERMIIYDPRNRPEVSNLSMLASLASGQDLLAIAGSISDRGASVSRALATEFLNEVLAPTRAHRAELIANEDYLLEILCEGNEHTNAQADETLLEVRQAIQINYRLPSF